jgi:inorganic triphosphatase YgiF
MEIEFKFHIPAERLKAVEAALRRAPVQRTRLQARYFDTEAGALAAQGAVLRLRKEGRRWVQTAKALGGGPLHRLEHNVDLGVASASATPVPDVRRHAGTPVGERLAQLLSGAGAPLVETYGTDIWRLARQVRTRGAVVELALDTGTVSAHPPGGGAPRSAPVCELELELVRGDVQGLVALAHRWSQQHGLWFSTVSKAERGERLLAGHVGASAMPAVKASASRFGAKGDGFPGGPALQRAVVASCLAQMLPNASEVAADSEDAEQIHQLRIGIRRLRTALRELAALGPGFDAAWEPPLVEAFRALGARRDAEQVQQTLAPQLQEAGAPPMDLPAGDAAVPSAGEVVRAAGFQSALVGLIGFTARGLMREAASAEEGASPADARRHLRTRLRKLHAHAVHDGERFESLAPEARHKVRKRLKRLRYLAEFVAPLFDADRARKYLGRLGPAQDALGRANDEQVALGVYRAAAQRDPRAWFAVGWLSARQPAGARASQRALRKIDGAPKFWKARKG